MNPQDLPQPTAAFLTAAAKFVLGKSSSADLIRAATQLLGTTDSPPESLVTLAALPDDDVRRDELTSPVDDVVRDLGLPQLTAETAAEILVRDTARQTANGAIDPYKGARTIWYTGRALHNGTSKLATFMQLMDDWENNLPNRAAIEDEIRNAAASIDTI